MNKLRVLDLFSGIGGFSLGLERTGGFETVAFCEYEAFPRSVLARHFPDVPCFPDVRILKGSDIDGPIDLICGGYPCQPFSTAGQRRGKEDDRRLWPEFSRLVAELRPAWVIGENVAGHISMGLDDVLSDLEGQGYACRTFVIPACAVGAVHRRDRVWTIGHSNQNLRKQPAPVAINHEAKQYNEFSVFDAPDPERIRQSGQGAHRGQIYTETLEHRKTNQPFHALGWPTKPAICGGNDGLPSGLVSARLKALGNAVVPQVVEMLGLAILEAQNGN